MPPAGQGAIALVCREGDERAGAIAHLDHRPTRRCVDVERGVMLELGASCQVPLGIWASPDGQGIMLRCLWLSPDGSWAKRYEARLRGAQDVLKVAEDMRSQWGWS